jgi:Rrf2 family iron-sulfur cluster assembly transcriptional regulator
MVDLALNSQGGPARCSAIATRQEVSDQYLAQLFLRLKRADLVESVRGPGGGYMLARGADQITAGDVLRAVDETLEPVYCVDEHPQATCHRIDGCPTHWLWAKLGDAIHNVLDSVTLEELYQQARVHLGSS